MTNGRQLLARFVDDLGPILCEILDRLHLRLCLSWQDVAIDGFQLHHVLFIPWTRPGDA